MLRSHKHHVPLTRASRRPVPFLRTSCAYVPMVFCSWYLKKAVLLLEGEIAALKGKFTQEAFVPEEMSKEMSCFFFLRRHTHIRTRFEQSSTHGFLRILPPLLRRVGERSVDGGLRSGWY